MLQPLSVALATLSLPLVRAAYIPNTGSTSHLSRRDDINITSPEVEELQARQSVGRCGPNFGTSCESGYCCSSVGWCGLGYSYCSSPSCNINYSDGCDAITRPPGTDTADIPRPHVGSVPYGSDIYRCNSPGDIALTYDDGPYHYTSDLLDMLKRYGAHATFYITGNNLGKGMITDDSKGWPDLIRRMIADGHQIASHTWGHHRMSTLTSSQIRTGMIYNEIALNNILGFVPTYMRPPYSDCNDQCRGIMDDLGYHITYFNLDTAGYLNNAADAIQNSKNIWDDIVEGSSPAGDSWLHIEHDPVYYSVYSLTEHMLNSMTQNGWRGVTVGDCLNDDPANWYRAVDGTVPDHEGPPGPGVPPPGTTTTTSTSPSSTTSDSPPSSTSLESTTDGRCGVGFLGKTCLGSRWSSCCSRYGWCGETDGHCLSGCQPEYGNCGTDQVFSSAPEPEPTTTVSTTITVPTPGLEISTNGRCGNGVTCTGSRYNRCCSKYGWCGKSNAHCEVSKGCQPLFGVCN